MAGSSNLKSDVTNTQVSQAYIPRMFDQRESELDAKARMVQEKVRVRLWRARDSKRLCDSLDLCDIHATLISKLKIPF